MKLPLILAIAVATASPCLAESDTSLVGKWVLWNPRTVIGTGQTDTVLNITGRPKDYRVNHTSGAITRVRTSEGHFIFKTATTTFSRIPLKRKGDLYSFSLPGKNQAIYLRPATKQGKKALVISQENGEEAGARARPFYKTEDDKTDAGGR